MSSLPRAFNVLFDYNTFQKILCWPVPGCKNSVKNGLCFKYCTLIGPRGMKRTQAIKVLDAFGICKAMLMQYNTNMKSMSEMWKR